MAGDDQAHARQEGKHCRLAERAERKGQGRSRQLSSSAYAHFETTFRKNAPFDYQGPALEAYAMLDKYNVEVNEVAVEVEKFREVEELFEIPHKDYAEVSETLKEMRQLKHLWDFKELVSSMYEEWRGILWSAIDTELLDSENKKIMKALRQFTNTNQIVKGYQVYKDLEEEVKSMDAILPLVNELHSKAMRDRHWKAVAEACKSEEVIDIDNPNFSFDDLLKIGIKDYVEDVEEITEVAAKELKIDKKLKIIIGLWKNLELKYVQHKDTEIKLVKVPDEVIEALEDHALELQTIIGMGKFVDYFRDTVMLWQKRLGDVEAVIKEWLSVTKQWASLETIFLASADIRAAPRGHKAL